MLTFKDTYVVGMLALLVVGCDVEDVPTDAGMLPTRSGATIAGENPMFELVDADQRLDAGVVNAHVYGSFTIPFAGTAVAILSGPANFPGNPPGGPGTCVNGLWYNSKGKATAGSVDHPHPHCVTASSAMTVVLEPISASAHLLTEHCIIGAPCDFVRFTGSRESPLSVIQSNPTPKNGLKATEGTGIVVGYAIDVATINGANTRVGIITFDLNQYDNATENLFGLCSVGEVEFGCLPLILDAMYTPLVVGGVGTPQPITGFLWWAQAGAPYNY